MWNYFCWWNKYYYKYRIQLRSFELVSNQRRIQFFHSFDKVSIPDELAHSILTTWRLQANRNLLLSFESSRVIWQLHMRHTLNRCAATHSCQHKWQTWCQISSSNPFFCGIQHGWIPCGLLTWLTKRMNLVEWWTFEQHYIMLLTYCILIGSLLLICGCILNWIEQILHCSIVPPLKDVFRTTSSGIR